MAQADIEQPAENDPAPGGEMQLESGTYEIIRSRLSSFSADLRDRLGQLNEARKQVWIVCCHLHSNVSTPGVTHQDWPLKPQSFHKRRNVGGDGRKIVARVRFGAVPVATLVEGQHAEPLCKVRRCKLPESCV